MNANDAMNILSLTGTVTQKEIKAAYKKASLEFHPDRNPAGAEMMKVINDAYNSLKNLGETVTSSVVNADNYAHILNEKLNAFFNLNLEGVEVEICGNWVWLTGNTKPHCKALGKDGLGFFYAGKKKAWYYRPADYKSFNRKNHSLDEIRSKHGSKSVKRAGNKAIAA